jgi:hypothetical protein
MSKAGPIGGVVVTCAMLAVVSVTAPAGAQKRGKDAAAAGAAQAAADPYALSQAAAKAGQFRIARKHLIQFIETSVGEARVGGAREMLPGLWKREADQLVKKGMEPEAAGVLMECAAHFKDGGEAEQARRQAREILKAGYSAAAKAKDFEKAAACVDAYDEHALAPPAIAPDDELRALRADWLADGVKQRVDPAVLYQRLERSMKAGVTAADLWERKLTVEQLRRAFVRSLFDDGYYDMAIELLKG